ncbi:MAG: carboxypeptidase-like regulatory domain-containing protein [Myxococcales bacterium]|nr:carboxypeptidase-like regulatory domain-containing protein [Myxococcales bacterium]
MSARDRRLFAPVAAMMWLCSLACGDSADDGGDAAVVFESSVDAMDAAVTGMDAGSSALPRRQAMAPGTQPTGQGPLSIDPIAPLTDSRIVARVISPEGQPLANVAVAAGGAAFITNADGYAFIEEVRAVDDALVSAQAFSFTRAMVRVPLRSSETSHALLMLTPRSFRWLDPVDAPLSYPGLLEDGGVNDVGMDGVQLGAAAEALQYPWGEPARGNARLSYALIEEPQQAGAIPGQMLALVDGSLQPLWARAGIEVRAFQGNSELVLGAELTVEFPVPRLDAAQQALEPALSLYHFDEAQGAFVERGTLGFDGEVAALGIDAFGHWLIAGPAGTGRCVAGRVLDAAGSGLGHAAVIAVHEGLLAASYAHSDAAGDYCASQPEIGSSQLFSMGYGALGPAAGVATAAPSAAASCGGSDCMSVDLESMTSELICARGVVDSPLGPLNIRAIEDGEGASIPVDQVAAGVPFCVPVAVGAQLVFTGSGVKCGEPRTVGAGAGLCGLDGCADLGTVQCCLIDETCGDDSDDDCDGRVDEGCSCGTEVCPEIQPGRCCSDLGRCTRRSAETDHCLDVFTAYGVNPSCPVEQIPLVDSSFTVIVNGCCTLAGTCGLADSYYGCIPREQAHLRWSLDTPLTTVSCVP